MISAKPSLLVLLEPAFDNSTYESKYLPLLMKYVDSSLFDVNVIGSKNSVHMLKGEFPKVHSIPVYPKNSYGIKMFLGYISYLTFSFFASIRISKRSHCEVLVSLGGHPYTGLIVSIVAKICKKKSIVRISEPTRIVVNGRYVFGNFMFYFVNFAEYLFLALQLNNSKSGHVLVPSTRWVKADRTKSGGRCKPF